MMFRLCWRFSNIPLNRPGGAWWHQDFATEKEARSRAAELGLAKLINEIIAEYHIEEINNG